MDSASALANLQNYQKSILTPEAAAEQANNELGVSGAQQQVQGLRGAIARTSGLLQQVAPSVYGRTQGSLVTNAQAGRQIQNEQAPIAQELETQNRDYGTASEDYKDLQSRAQAKAAGTLQGQQGQLSYLQQLYHDIAGKEQAERDEAFRQAQLAEQRRQADMSAAEARAARAASGGGAGLSLGSMLGGGGASASSGGSPTASLAGLNPSQAVARLFEGYQPGVAKYKGYTENAALSALTPIVARVLPGRSPAEIKQQALKLLYDYRKKNFGE